MSLSSNNTVYIPPMNPVPNSNRGPQAPSPAAGQAQSHPHVPGAQGLSSPTRIASGNLANAGPTALVAPPEMNGDEWTGTLYFPASGAFQARARGTEAVGNLKLSAWPRHLQLEPGVDPQFNIQAWIGNTGASWVPLRPLDETYGHQFDKLVRTLRNGPGYATARLLMDRGRTLGRLLLAPVDQSLLCVAFPDNITPTHQVATNHGA
ncbi:hypothetical protein DFH94DRAFT_858072 [Russula ochroleuca]|nr:hypothetical protein DFH94DRAFT_858072 [Russula ochroleuca]